jgi:hypothetical protein
LPVSPTGFFLLGRAHFYYLGSPPRGGRFTSRPTAHVGPALPALEVVRGPCVPIAIFLFFLFFFLLILFSHHTHIILFYNFFENIPRMKPGHSFWRQVTGFFNPPSSSTRDSDFTQYSRDNRGQLAFTCHPFPASVLRYKWQSLKVSKSHLFLKSVGQKKRRNFDFTFKK